MRYEAFIETIEQRSGLPREEAERTAVTVLQALCDRLTGDEAFDLLAQLPARLMKRVTITRAPLPLTRDELVAWVADELGVEPGEARDRVRAVFSTIREAISLGEFRDILEQLDPDYADLLA
jgi:uncharacterized protein (DUF2267 family)